MEIEAGIIRRARQFMPVVVILLYATGILMRSHFPDLSTMPESSFGRLLMVKIVLASIVLVCFVSAMTEDDDVNCLEDRHGDHLVRRLSEMMCGEKIYSKYRV